MYEYTKEITLLGGVAKDLTKLGGKTVTKLVTPEEKQVRLFKLVSALTGYKNSLKGVGYFMGAALLEVGGRERERVQCPLISTRAYSILLASTRKHARRRLQPRCLRVAMHTRG